MNLRPHNLASLDALRSWIPTLGLDCLNRLHVVVMPPLLRNVSRLSLELLEPSFNWRYRGTSLIRNGDSGIARLIFLQIYEDARLGGGVRIHPENARMSGRHGVQYVAQCVACAALTPVVWQ